MLALLYVAPRWVQYVINVAGGKYMEGLALTSPGTVSAPPRPRPRLPGVRQTPPAQGRRPGAARSTRIPIVIPF